MGTGAAGDKPRYAGDHRQSTGNESSGSHLISQRSSFLLITARKKKQCRDMVTASASGAGNHFSPGGFSLTSKQRLSGFHCRLLLKGHPGFGGVSMRFAGR
jgi:hypothetical protein